MRNIKCEFASQLIASLIPSFIVGRSIVFKITRYKYTPATDSNCIAIINVLEGQHRISRIMPVKEIEIDFYDFH
jgi:hypothetical protein